MSVALENLVWEQNRELGGSDLLVMLALAWYADDDGRAWPAVKSIAERTRVSVRSVQYILNRLQSAGYISIEQGRGRTHTSTYRVIPERFGECEKVQQPLHLLNKEATEKKVQSGAEKVQVEAEKVQPSVLKGAIAIAPDKQERQGKTEEKQGSAREVQPQLFRPVPKSESARAPAPPPERPHRLQDTLFDGTGLLEWAEREAKRHDAALNADLLAQKFANYYGAGGRGSGERLTDEGWEAKWRQWTLDEIDRLVLKGAHAQ